VHDVTQIFLNYRGVDEPFGATLLDTLLSERFGSAAVFLASKSILPGARWEAEIMAAVAGSAALLVVVGRNWVDALDEDGGRKIDDPDDFVRREILLAAELDKKIIPVLLGRRRLSGSELPKELAVLLGCQSIEVRFRCAKVDIDRLADKLVELIPELHRPRGQDNTVGARLIGNNNSTGNFYQADRFKIGTFNAGSTVHLHYRPNRETEHG
jgi:hypothetical protein